MLSNVAYELHVCDLWKYILFLRELGHTPVSIKRTGQGFALLVSYKCGITEFMTVREREILDYGSC